MFGLGKKPTPEVKLDIPVVTIPTEFYAGANPTIVFREEEKVITPKKPEPVVMSPADKKAFDVKTAAGANEPLHPVHVLGNHRKMIFIGVGLFVLFIAGGGAYAWWQAKQAEQQKVPVAPKVTVNSQNNVVPETNSNDNQTNNGVVVSTSTPIPVSVMEFPSLMLTKAEDADNDGLTDHEEIVYGSDPGKPDTDDDSFLDGSEVYHLYNPIGKEPIKLIESGKVREYVNPVFGYSLYYPNDWALGNVDPEYRDVLFSTISGDNIEVKVFDKDPGVQFSEWLASSAPEERYGDLTDFSTRFNDPGLKRYDEIVYYFVSPTKVYVLVYHTTGNTVINYPAVIEVMARSFKRDSTKETVIEVPVTPETITATNSPEGVPLEESVITPAELVLPSETGPTTTSEIL